MINKWNDDTKKISHEDYISAQKRFFDFFAMNPGVVGYGTFGSIQAPGLSDLDLIVVVKDECLKQKKFSFPSFEGGEGYVFLHTPLVVPLSLFSFLPYYHFIDIKWAHRGPDLAEKTETENNNVTLGFIHVLEKTLYLQSFFWWLFYKTEKPCRRSIVALTSLARSIQILQSLSIPVKEPEAAYVKNILSLRDEWHQFPEKRKSQILKLDALFQEALKISVGLPETAASYFLKIKNEQLIKSRGLQRAPMNFILETRVDDPERILSTVNSARFLSRLYKITGKFGPFIIGSFAFAGPLTFSILDLDFLISKNYRRRYGAYQWGQAVDHELTLAIKEKLAKILQNKFSANLKFATAMNTSGLQNSNFGTVWIHSGIYGFILCCLSWTTGRLRILRRLQYAINNK